MSDVKNPFLDKMRKRGVVFACILLVVGVLFYAVITVFDKNRNDEKTRVKNHITVVIAIDKNCNDCHLGASFVNLFNHDAVRANDNVARFIMNKVNIKRW